MLPPGDLRMALAALCDDTEWGHTWRDVLQHRFHGAGPLGGHALGNLLITALWDLDRDTVAGLDLVGRLLDARGRVLPMAAVPLEITAQREGARPVRRLGGQTVRGQVEVASTPGRVRGIAPRARTTRRRPPRRSRPSARRTGSSWAPGRGSPQ